MASGRKVSCIIYYRNNTASSGTDMTGIDQLRMVLTFPISHGRTTVHI